VKRLNAVQQLDNHLEVGSGTVMLDWLYFLKLPDI
jgi:hypothetical protein